MFGYLPPTGVFCVLQRTDGPTSTVMSTTTHVAPAYLLEGTASFSSASAFLKLVSPSLAPLKCPNRTTTRSCNGIIIVFWPPAPDMKYEFRGTGYCPSPLIQKKPP